MAKLYIGDSQGAPALVKIEEVPKLKFGASIDTFLGDIDENGNYTPPTENFVLDLTGVKHIPDSGFSYAFYGHKGIIGLIADDIVSVGKYGLQYAFYGSSIKTISFRNLEVVDKYMAFSTCFGATVLSSVVFPKLKEVSGQAAFQYAFSNHYNFSIDPSDMFPSLECISGNSAFNDFTKGFIDNIALFPKLKKITGGTSLYSATFYSSDFTTAVFKLPEVTEITSYVFASSFKGEIHFAAANQAVIEACEGYSYKWGATNATIYFDL